MFFQSRFKFNKSKSQDIPGFSIWNVPYLSAIVFCLVLIVGLVGLTNNPNHFVLTMPKAEASAHLQNGIKEFSRAQKLYMARALKSNHDNLIKLQGAAIQAIMSEPELIRSDFPSVMWQYRSDYCVLDVYFKTDNTNKNVYLENVVHYEMRDREHNPDEDFTNRENTCIQSLLLPIKAARLLSVSSIYKSVIN